jgi:glycosyltransferase involved in cell wall biosynthesis
MNNYFEVVGVSSKGKELQDVKVDEEIRTIEVNMSREITPIKDFISLLKMIFLFLSEKPDIVHTHTPKAGVIGMLAAKLAKVKVRMHTVAGLPLMEEKGVRKIVLNTVERLTSFGAHYIYPNSFALKDLMEIENLAPVSKLKVIGRGSTNGINTSEFSRSIFFDDHIIDLRKQLGLFDSDMIFVFIGRIVKDKGINELLFAFDKLLNTNSKVKLILVGSEERELDPISKDSREVIKRNKQIISVGWQDDVRPYLTVSDVFVFPSYREGFPNVVMQAGAMGLPSIVTNINGSNEIIEDGVNGLIIPVKDEVALYGKMKLLAEDLVLRESLSKSARKMIIDRYEQKFVWNELLKEYIRLLDSKNIAHNITF